MYHLHVMGIPFETKGYGTSLYYRYRSYSDVGILAFSASPLPKPKASPVTLTLTLTHVAKVIWEGDAFIIRVLGMGMPKIWGYRYHCNTALATYIGPSTCKQEKTYLPK